MIITVTRPYDELRREAYKSWEEQNDMMYWDKVNGTTLWADHIADVKVKFPKSSSETTK